MINEETAEVKYWITNALDQPLERIVRAAFQRTTIEHGFRLSKTEIGLTNFEGRTYVGLMRHMILTLIAMGFVAGHTHRLRGKNPGTKVTREQVCRILRAVIATAIQRANDSNLLAQAGNVVRDHQQHNAAAETSRKKRQHEFKK